MTLQDKVDLLEAKAGEVLFERSNEIKCIINALLSRKHIVLLGPPGVAKSMLTRTMVNLIDGIEDGEYFEWALTKFTEPSEVVGPHSITQMTQDRYIRTTRRKLPEAKICFLDETFCGSSALLNVLLPILNERIFYNNDEPTKVPLSTLVGASNFSPEDNTDLAALWDRITFRVLVKPLQDDENFVKMLKNVTDPPVLEPVLSWDELLEAQEQVKGVKISDTTHDALTLLKDQMKLEGIVPSDRRFGESLPIIQAQAWRQGREETNINDTRILANVLWTHQSQITMVRKLTLNLANPLDKIAMDILDGVEGLSVEIEELKRSSAEDNMAIRNNKAIELNKTLSEATEELKTLKKRAQTENRECEFIQPAIDRVVYLSKVILYEIFEHHKAENE